jgi:hypothetical protein
VRQLEQIVRDANEALFDVCEADPEHQILYHSDTLSTTYRLLAAAANRALEVLQVEIRNQVERHEPKTPDGPNVRWGWADREDASFWQGATTREEAIESARETFGEDVDVWIRWGTLANASDCLPDADRLLDDMSQYAADNGCPDEIDEAFDVADGAGVALEELLAAWAAKYVRANWWEPVGSPELVKATESMDESMDRR